MSTVDWVALAVVAAAALAGFRRGLVVTALSLAGLVAGAFAGSRVAPYLLEGRADARWTPAAALVGAVIGAVVLRAAASLAGSVVRSGLRLTPLGALDALGGLVVGAVAGLALVWVLGAAALRVPGLEEWRNDVRGSEILRRLNELAPPSRLLALVGGIDPLPELAGPRAGVGPPSAKVLHLPGVRAAAPSVVRVIGTACGFGTAGSGWVAARGLVVTAAHVVAGQRRTLVQAPGGPEHRAQAVVFDPRNDLAVLRVRGLGALPLRLAEPREGEPVAIIGYPENGALAAVAGRIGRTTTLLADDLYGGGPIERRLTSVRGRVRHGNSGGPAVDGHGAVLATIFGATRGPQRTGLAAPASLVRAALARAHGPVSTRGCTT